MGIMETDLLGKVASVSILPLHAGVAEILPIFRILGEAGSPLALISGWPAFRAVDGLGLPVGDLHGNSFEAWYSYHRFQGTTFLTRCNVSFPFISLEAQSRSTTPTTRKLKTNDPPNITE